MPDPLMKDRRGLVMGVANDHSIAWGVARTLSKHGAEIAFTYQGEAQGKRLAPLAESIGSRLLLQADVENDSDLDTAFALLAREWGRLDFVVHAIAYSERDELKRRYVETSRDNFCRSLAISCFSFTDIARRALPLMTNGGALLTFTYLGAHRVTPNYNVMGVAKAALESSVRYLAADLGADNIRVNAISAGPMRTLAGSVISESRTVFKWNKAHSPLKRTVSLDDVGNAAVYLLSDLSRGVTGEIHYVDAGYNIIGTPPSTQLKGWIGPDDRDE
jgi:enoyl-[acyl-carrier protein] reductase I